MKWDLLPLLTVLLACCAKVPNQTKEMLTNQSIYATVRLDIQGDKLLVELLVENRQAIDVYVPDVAFLTTKDGVKINQAALPTLLNKDNNVQIDLIVKALDPKVLWATPPTFYTHLVKAHSSYHRRWSIPYPILIASQDNQGMGRMVPVSQDVLVNVGAIVPPVNYGPKVVEIDGETLYQFRYDALQYQAIYPVVLRNRSLKVIVNE